MDLISNLGMGFQVAFQPINFAYCFLGVFVGTVIGVLPGVGALATISMLLPLTFHTPPEAAMAMLAGIYYGAMYGGSITAIMLKLPGTPSAAVTTLDGHPLAQQGRAGTALFTAMFCSFLGGTVGIVLLTACSPLLAGIAFAFGPVDYFSMMMLGLIAATTLSQGSPIKGIAMVLVGLALGFVGTDVQTGMIRFSLGFLDLADGISLVALAMGLFGVAEVITSIKESRQHRDKPKQVSMRDMIPTRDDLKLMWKPVLRGSSVGSVIGALPGIGAGVAIFIAYALEKKVAKDPSRFGKGAIEGVAAPESANNAAVPTAFIPTLTLGIPGDSVMALMLGALIIHGIRPGPALMTEHPTVFWGLIASFWIGNVLLLALNVPLIRFWVRLLTIPYHILYPAILVFTCVGVYSVNGRAFDVFVALAFGVIGFAMNLLKFEVAPLLLGFILGPLMEEYLRRAMQLSRGDATVFFTSPISAGFLVACVLLILWSSLPALRRKRAEKAEALEKEVLANADA